jgi:hypothetical protein
VGGGDDARVCPAPAVTTPLDVTTSSCTDLSPPSGATTYYVVAVDRDAAGLLREGDRRALPIAAPGAPPSAPTALAATTVNGSPVLSWAAPASGSLSFYRIYRDGTAVAYADRYGRTSDATRTFTDNNPGGVSHKYWVTAVDGSYNESSPTGPVSWAAP